MHVVFWLFVALATSASFTSSTTNELPPKKPFEAYTGDLEKLKGLLRLCDEHNLTQHLNLEATNLDDVFPTDLVLDALVDVCKVDNDELRRLGTLLADLSPERFDIIASWDFELDRLILPGEPLTPNQPLIEGYTNVASVWKQSVEYGTRSLLENARLQPRLSFSQTKKYCEMMKEDGYFIHLGAFLQCVKIWMTLKKNDFETTQSNLKAVRNACEKSPAFKSNSDDVAKAFVGFEVQYLELIISKVRMDRWKDGRISILSSTEVSDLERLKPLSFDHVMPSLEYLLTDANHFDLALFNATRAVNANSTLKSQLFGVEYGLDPVKFMDSWTIAPVHDRLLARLKPFFWKAIHGIPHDRRSRCIEDALNIFYNFGIEKPLLQYSYLDELGTLMARFWIQNAPHRPVKVDRYEAMKPHLERLLQSPVVFANLQGSSSEGIFGNDLPTAQRNVNLDFFLFQSHAAMALSANYKLLDLFLKEYTPEDIIAVCKFPVVRARMMILLHLNPKVVSYRVHPKLGKIPISKSSTEFRDWVFHHLESPDHLEANKKLLSYYFDNVVNNVYPDGRDIVNFFGFGLQSSNRINYAIEMGTINDSFAQQSTEMEEPVGVKRAREDNDDDGPERKKQKTEQQ